MRGLLTELAVGRHLALREVSSGADYRLDGQGQLWRATLVTPRQWRRARRARGKEE